MRIVFDAQAAQTESRFRGIGRYVTSLAQALAVYHPETVDLQIALDGTYPQDAGRVRAELRDLLPGPCFSRYVYDKPRLPWGNPKDPRRRVASTLIAHHYALLCPTVVLQGSMMEGYIEHAVNCEDAADVPGTLAVAIAYDLIPWKFPDKYLPNADAKRFYARKLHALSSSNHLLAISECTKKDLVEIAGIDPRRVTVIYAGIADIFAPCSSFNEGGKREALRHLGVSREYILYTGNDDYRKNCRGMLDAYAKLPKELRSKYQLVLNQTADNEDLRSSLRSLGINRRDVVITGRVGDEDLADLMRGCSLFCFPSLYEGFGLPVVEAMACGAPVVAGDNSSLREILEPRWARFDARDPKAIADCVANVLTDDSLQHRLREYGIRRARDFNWERTAELAVDGMRGALEAQRCELDFPPIATRSRKKMAMFTPLPPEHTGIANYAVSLLPSLAQYYDIDVFTTNTETLPVAIGMNFNVYSWERFEASGQKYDLIVYQVGNSPFHTHMFDMMARHRGVVILHDVFLSSAYWYLERVAGHASAFERELRYGHGPAAAQTLHVVGGDDICRDRYPCNRRVIESSIGVVVHSQSARRLLQKSVVGFLPKLISVIPSVKACAPMLDERETTALKQELGYSPDDFLVCSFGFIADTKLCGVIVDAIAESSLLSGEHVHFVLVGELDGGAYGRDFQALVARSPNSERVHITGFVDNETYERYLSVCNVAIQLRCKSRGETSAAVLDCLAHGVPTIVNAHGSLRDYPSSIFLRLDDRVDSVNVRSALERLVRNPVDAAELGRVGRRYIAEVHAPAHVAAKYASEVDRMSAIAEFSGGENVIATVADALDGTDVDEELLAGVEAGLRGCVGQRRVPRIVVDFSEVVHVDYGTGIHRVVRNLTRELLVASKNCGYECVPAFLDEGSYRAAADYVRGKLKVSEEFENGALRFSAGDILLMLDSAWDQPERFLPVMEDAESNGAEIVGYVHDLIPIRYPAYCAPHMPQAFRRWLVHTVATSHAIICVSRATADDLHAFIADESIPHRPCLRLHYVHHGCDLETATRGPQTVPSDYVRRAFEGDARTFLMVGTVEPRKGYDIALEAMDRLWATGSEATLYIAGKQGWGVERLAGQLESHPQRGKRLHWAQSAPDADLTYAYQNATALVQASRAEGFGLPLLEARRYGTPVICSNIPVFKEIGGDSVRYFEVDSASSLAEALAEARTGEVFRQNTQRCRTWRDAAIDLMKVLGSSAAYKEVA